MVQRCYLKSSLVIFLKNARGLFPGKWPVRDTAYKYTSLEMWTTFIITIHKVVQECTFCTGMSVLSPENNKDIEGWKLSELTPHHTFTLHSTQTAFDSADWQYFIQRLFSILNQNKACNLQYNAYL